MKERVKKAVKKAALKMGDVTFELKTHGKHPVILMVESAKSDPSETDTLADEIWESAETYAEANGTSAKFVLETKEGSVTIARLLFNVKVEGEDGFEVTQDDVTSTAALLNSVRVYNQTSFHMIGQLFEMMRSENLSLRERAQHHDDLFAERFRLLEEIRNEAHERNLEILKETRAEDRKERLLGDLETKLLPAVIGRITGLSAVSQFVNKIRPEQLEQLSAILDEDQRDSLQKVLSMVPEEKEPIQ